MVFVGCVHISHHHLEVRVTQQISDHLGWYAVTREARTERMAQCVWALTYSQLVSHLAPVITNLFVALERPATIRKDMSGWRWCRARDSVLGLLVERHTTLAKYATLPFVAAQDACVVRPIDRIVSQVHGLDWTRTSMK